MSAVDSAWLRMDRPGNLLVVNAVFWTSEPADLDVLRAVIEEYVTTAQPVGSHALVERYRLGVSSATVEVVVNK